MLQFVIGDGSRFSAAELAQMAFEGGCRWVQLSASAALREDGRALKDIALDVVPLCRENDAFLVIEDDVDLVDELKVHGVFLHNNARQAVMEVRERLGADAIIGVYASTLDEILALRGVDVDYVAVPEPDVVAFAPGLPVADRYAAIHAGMRESGVDFHLVALGEFPVDMLPALLDAGCAGVAMASAIAEADRPDEAAKCVVEALDHARFGE